MKQRILPPNFIYPVINEKHRAYGGSFLLNPIIKPNGDWRKSLPPYEQQRRNGVEPSSCFIEAQQHSIATVEEDQLGEKDNNYSARFNAFKAEGTEYGGDPIMGADSIRHDGLVKEDSMPHDASLMTWNDFHSWKGVDKEKVIREGQADLLKKERNFGVIIERHYPLEAKYSLIENGLKRAPLPMSVWGVTDGEGNYLPKPKGAQDTHLVEATYLDVENKVIHILDTYPPFEKKLPANYDPDFAMGWTVQKKEASVSKDNWLVSLLKSLLTIIKPVHAPDVVKPAVVPELTPRERLYNAALTFLGTDASPDDVAPDDLACAESVNAIHFKTFGEYIETPGISTTKLFAAMVDQQNKFVRVLDPEPGNIIISPTGFNPSSNPMKHGHVGIFGKDEKIMSNSSTTGKFEENYTITSWIERYRKQGGYPIYFFKRI